MIHECMMDRNILDFLKKKMKNRIPQKFFILQFYNHLRKSEKSVMRFLRQKHDYYRIFYALVHENQLQSRVFLLLWVWH